MRHDNGTVLAIAGVAALTALAAISKSKTRGRGSRSYPVRLPSIEGRPILDAASVEAMREDGSLWDFLGEAYSGIWYIPDETEIASVQWAADHGYDPGRYLVDSMRQIPWPILLGASRMSAAYLIEPIELKSVMLIAKTDRIPNISDDLGIQSVLFGMAPSSDDLPNAVFHHISTHLEAEGIPYNQDALWDFVEYSLAGELTRMRSLIHDHEPAEALEQMKEAGLDLGFAQLQAGPQ